MFFQVEKKCTCLLKSGVEKIVSVFFVRECGLGKLVLAGNFFLPRLKSEGHVCGYPLHIYAL